MPYIPLFRVIGVPRVAELEGFSLIGYIPSSYTVEDINQIFRNIGVEDASIPEMVKANITKQTYEWALEVKYEDEYIIFDIYDYKNDRWHIGGKRNQKYKILDFLIDIGFDIG